MISIHAPRGGSDAYVLSYSAAYVYFNPRSPRGERPLEMSYNKAKLSRISIHAPRGGSDLLLALLPAKLLIFQSTLPAGGATRSLIITPHLPGNFNPRSPRGERPGVYHNCPEGGHISIHAPRGGSDPTKIGADTGTIDFNPRSPRGERRFSVVLLVLSWIFQSTLPAGGATHYMNRFTSRSGISIHAPRGGSDVTLNQLSKHNGRFQSTLPAGGATGRISAVHRLGEISIHAPRGGSDLRLSRRRGKEEQFQSTLPAGGATIEDAGKDSGMEISIHAPRGGSDLKPIVNPINDFRFQSTLPAGGATWFCFGCGLAGDDFNPRSPRGERPITGTATGETLKFQSTLPVGGATSLPGTILKRFRISIHAPRGGSDVIPWF